MLDPFSYPFVADEYIERHFLRFILVGWIAPAEVVWKESVKCSYEFQCRYYGFELPAFLHVHLKTGTQLTVILMKCGYEVNGPERNTRYAFLFELNDQSPGVNPGRAE